MSGRSFGPGAEAGADLPLMKGAVLLLKSWALVHHVCWPVLTDRLQHGVYMDSGGLAGWGR